MKVQFRFSDQSGMMAAGVSIKLKVGSAKPTAATPAQPAVSGVPSLTGRADDGTAVPKHKRSRPGGGSATHAAGAGGGAEAALVARRQLAIRRRLGLAPPEDSPWAHDVCLLGIDALSAASGTTWRSY